MKGIVYIISIIILSIQLFWLASFLYVSFPTFWFSNIPQNNESISTFATGVVSSMALASAFVAIYLQKQELEATRKELHDQKEELNRQNQIMQEQKFEQTFNSLFNSYKQSLTIAEGDVQISSNKYTNLHGGAYLANQLKKIESDLINRPSDINNILLELEFIFSQYYYLVSFINDYPGLSESTRSEYFKRIGSVSFIELVFIALFGVNDVISDKKVFGYINKEHLLDRLINRKTNDSISFLSEYRNIKNHLQIKFKERGVYWD